VLNGKNRIEKVITSGVYILPTTTTTKMQKPNGTQEGHPLPRERGFGAVGGGLCGLFSFSLFFLELPLQFSRECLEH
jgi:hypothetical protein